MRWSDVELSFHAQETKAGDTYQAESVDEASRELGLLVCLHRQVDGHIGRHGGAVRSNSRDVDRRNSCGDIVVGIQQAVLASIAQTLVNASSSLKIRNTKKGQNSFFLPDS